MNEIALIFFFNGSVSCIDYDENINGQDLMRLFSFDLGNKKKTGHHFMKLT